MVRALIRNKPILILDEISANLDPEAAVRIENLLLSERERTVISISHKLPDGVREKYDSVLELKTHQSGEESFLSVFRNTPDRYGFTGRFKMLYG